MHAKLIILGLPLIFSICSLTAWANEESCAALKVNLTKERDGLRKAILESYEVNHAHGSYTARKAAKRAVQVTVAKISAVTTQWMKEKCPLPDLREIMQSHQENPVVNKFEHYLEEAGFRFFYNAQGDQKNDLAFVTFGSDCSDVKFRMIFIFSHPFDTQGSCNGQTNLWNIKASKYVDTNSLNFYFQKPTLIMDGLVVSTLAEKNLQILCAVKDLIIQNKSNDEIKKKLSETTPPCRRAKKN
jgi:hypothetical protein